MHETYFANTLNLNDKGPSIKWVCSPKFYGPLAIWPWLKINLQRSLNVIYCLVITAWQWLMSFTYRPCIPMQIKPNKSPLRKRLLALLLWKIGYLSSPSRSCLGSLVFICGSWGSPAAGAPPHILLLFINYCIIFHTNHCKPIFAPACITRFHSQEGTKIQYIIGIH